MWASRNGKLDIVQYLVEEKGVSYNFAGDDGTKVLRRACYHGHIDMVKYLMGEKRVDDCFKSAKIFSGSSCFFPQKMTIWVS